MTGEDLQYNPGVVERVKFKYSPFREALNEGLIKEKKKTKKSTTMISSMILSIILINTMHPILMKYHQLTLNLIH